MFPIYGKKNRSEINIFLSICNFRLLAASPVQVSITPDRMIKTKCYYYYTFVQSDTYSPVAIMRALLAVLFLLIAHEGIYAKPKPKPKPKPEPKPINYHWPNIVWNEMVNHNDTTFFT